MKMKIEIWSDIMCPFCYLGKRKFENALSQFAGKEHIEVEWKSFQLNPDLVTDPDASVQQYLTEHKGMSPEQAIQAGNYITQAGKAVGLEYHYDKVIMANTYRAQQLVKFAHVQGKQNDMEEKLFEAYFTKGKNVDDLPTLLQLANEVGLDSTGLQEALENNQFAAQVNADINEANLLRIHGVPYFLINRKFVVNGAQESTFFLETLGKAFADWSKDQPEIKTGPVIYSFNPN